MKIAAFVYNTLSGNERRIEFNQSTIKLGKMASSHIDFGDDGRISKMHAIVEIIDGQMRITDLNSENGTYINGNRISSEVIDLDDLIAIGLYRLIFVPLDKVHDVGFTGLKAGLDEISFEELQRRRTQVSIHLEEIGKQARSILEARKHFLEVQIGRHLQLGKPNREFPDRGNPYRSLYQEAQASKLMPSKPEDPTLVAHRARRLEADLHAMTIDRDGWKLNSERLEETVQLRDREIAALRDQIHRSRR